MLTSQDPVEAGVVASFARPGGNLTGVAFVSSETAGKRLQFLKEAIPSLTRVAVLWSPDHPDGEYRNAEATARRLGIHIQSLEVRGPGGFDGAFQAATVHELQPSRRRGVCQQPANPSCDWLGAVGTRG